MDRTIQYITHRAFPTEKYLNIQKTKQREKVYEGVPVIDYSHSADADAHSGKVIGFQDDFFTRKIESKSGKAEISVLSSAQEYLKNHPATFVCIWPNGHKAPELVYLPLHPQIFLSLKDNS